MIDQNYLILFGIGATTVVFTYKFFLKSKKKKRNVPAGTVLLHQFSQGPIAPNMSPFPIKLETYMRANKIPYETEYDDPIGPKKKCPWIEYNGESVADSQLCIEYLNDKFEIDMNKNLSVEDKAVARAFRIMIEDHYYWTLALQRWVYNNKAYEFARKGLKMSRFLQYIVSGMVKKASWGHGMGRHTPEECDKMGCGDLKALSQFLGNKPFLMGDEPCEEDFSIFGFLCQAVYHLPGTNSAALVNGELSNLRDYCERMKEKYWPDWDGIVKQ